MTPEKSIDHININTCTSSLATNCKREWKGDIINLDKIKKKKINDLKETDKQTDGRTEGRTKRQMDKNFKC